MDSHPAAGARPTPTTPALRPDTGRLAPGLVLYALLVLLLMYPCAGGSDSSGYLNCARLLGEGRVVAPMRRLPGLTPESLPPYTHVPLGFTTQPGLVTLVPTYPMGLPLLLMLTAKLVGWQIAPWLIGLLHALFGLWLTYQLARAAGLETGWAWLGAFTLGVSPLYLAMVQPLMSDVPAMAWATAAVLAAWRSRERTWLAPVAGAALAVAVLIRLTNLLVALPVGLALGWSGRRGLLLVLGGLPGAILLGAINHAAYGSAFATGYVESGWMFGSTNVAPTLAAYAHWLPMLLTPLCLLAPGLPWLGRTRPALGPALATWMVIVPAFYLFFVSTREIWWFLRYLLPSFPPIIVAALLVARSLLARFRLPVRAWWLVPASLAVLANSLAWSIPWDVFTFGRDERVYPETTAWVRRELPPNAVVAAMQTSGALFHDTDLTIMRWDQVSPDDFKRITAACAAAGRPIYAVLFPFEIDEPEWDAFKKHLPGNWTQVGAVRQVSIWRLGSPVASP